MLAPIVYIKTPINVLLHCAGLVWGAGMGTGRGGDLRSSGMRLWVRGWPRGVGAEAAAPSLNPPCLVPIGIFHLRGLAPGCRDFTGLAVGFATFFPALKGRSPPGRGSLWGLPPQFLPQFPRHTQIWDGVDPQGVTLTSPLRQAPL